MHNRTFNWDHIALVAVFVLTFLLYGNTIRNGYSLDDSYVTQNNPKVERGFAGIPEIFTSRYVDEEGNSFGYRPVAMATFAIEYGLWGQNPHRSHFINVLLYAIILLLLYKVLLKIFCGNHTFFVFAIVLLFAAHPIHTEAVASLKNRETLLSFFFSLSSLTLFLNWYHTRKILFAFWGLLCFIIAFLSKQDAVAFAVVIPLSMFFYSRDTLLPSVTFSLKLTSERILKILFLLSFLTFFYFSYHPQVWASALSFVLTFIILLFYYITFSRKQPGSANKRIHLWFMIAGIAFNILAGVFTKNYLALFALVCYAVFFMRIFNEQAIKNFMMPKYLLQIVILLLMIGLVSFIVYKLPDLYLPAEDKEVYHFENPQFTNASGYSTGPLAFCTLWFYLSKLLWPHPLGFYYGYQMIPEVGWTTPEVIFSLLFHLGILAFALWKLPKKHILSFAILYYLATISIFTNIVIKIPGIVGERLAFFPSLGFCIGLAYVIFRMLKIDIHAEQIPKTKTWWLAGIMLLIIIPYSAKTITRNRDWKDYLTLYSHDIGYLANSAKANNTYASQLLKEAYNNDEKNPAPEVRQEYLNLAVKHLKRTVEIDSTYKFAWNNLGFITYQYLGNSNEGIEYMNRAVLLDPAYAEAHFNLGYAFKHKTEYDSAVTHYRKARQINPRKMVFYTEEADTWILANNLGNAMELYRQAAEVDPSSDQPYKGLGNIYWLSGDTIQAIQNWEKAFLLNQSDLTLCKNLAGYYESIGDAKALFYRNEEKKLLPSNP